MSFRKVLPAAILLAALTPAAHAVVVGQVFHFNNPETALPDSSNAMFQTFNQTGNEGLPFATVTNLVGDGISTNDTITLLVDNFSADHSHTTDTYANVKYFLASYGTDPAAAPTTPVTNFSDYDNSTFSGGLVNGSTATGAGLLTFTQNGTILLQVSFGSSLLQAGGFNVPTNSGYHFLGGTKYESSVTNPTGTANLGFNFTNGADPNYHTSGLNFSFGNTQAVPEPASVATLALGGLALLRRRRRA